MYQTHIARLLTLVVLIDVCAMAGCHRGYYRRQADAEAQRLVLQKASDPRWNTADGSVEVDPMSRMFNPFSADHPPIPPDDASSHQLMHCVDGKQGYPHWHANGDTDHVENPDWKAYLPINENGQVILSLERAYQMAALHSTELQQQRETLYLSALDVSLERFGFDSQLFTGFNSFLSTRGRFRNASGQSSTELASSIGAQGEGLSLRRLGTTGANFAVGIANTILFNFSGSNTQSATTLIDFSVIQPLMRGAGRDRIMESLTQTERTLLANVRQFDRYQRGFYLQVAIGRSAGAGPSRSGNFLSLPGAATTNVGGYFGLLLQQQQIRNQEFNVRQLESVLEQFREFKERDRLDAIQLKLFESTVYSQQAALVTAKIRYETAVDRFKQSIGLPPDLDVVIDDEFLDRFELISDQINDRLIFISKLREQTGTALNQVVELLPVRADQVEATQFQWNDALKTGLVDLQPFLAAAEETLATIKQDDVQQLRGDFQKLDAVREDRIAYLARLDRQISAGEIDSSVDPLLYRSDSIPTGDQLRIALEDPDNPENVLLRIDNTARDLAEIKSIVAELENEKADLTPIELYEVITQRVQKRLPQLLFDLNNTLLEISLLQAQARSNSIEIYDVDIDSGTAINIARCMRRDWMNARASLVDNFRQIEFVADQLEAQVDLVFQGDIGNVGDNPLKLRYETGQLRAGFRFDSPLVRMAERNQYRETLINYQQSRRQFYQFEDEIKRNLRDIIRNLNRDKVLFELNRRSVQVQIEQIELNRLTLEEPIAVDATTTNLGGSTARNLTDAINGLNNSQNSFLGTWVEYEVLRRSLDFDLGTMQLDALGAWSDPGLIDATIGARAAAQMGIELDCQFCSTDVIFPTVQPDRTPLENTQSPTPGTRRSVPPGTQGSESSQMIEAPVSEMTRPGNPSPGETGDRSSQFRLTPPVTPQTTQPPANIPPNGSPANNSLEVQPPEIPSPSRRNFETAPPQLELNLPTTDKNSIYRLPKQSRSVLIPIDQPRQASFDLTPATRPDMNVTVVGFERDFGQSTNRESLTGGIVGLGNAFDLPPDPNLPSSGSSIQNSPKMLNPKLPVLVNSGVSETESDSVHLNERSTQNDGTIAPINQWQPSFRSFGNRFERFGGQR